jgi:hypothetical protein
MAWRGEPISVLQAWGIEDIIIMFRQTILLLCSLLLLLGCTGQGAPVASQPNAPPLTSDFVMDKDLVFESVEYELVLAYPADWTVEDVGSVYIHPSAADFQQDPGFALMKTSFTFYVTGPYVGRSSERWRIPQPSVEVAREILNTFSEHEILKPIESVDINGHDGAIFLVARPEETHQYIAVLRIAEHKAVVLGALGPAHRSEEMQAILNAIALNIRPLGEE